MTITSKDAADALELVKTSESRSALLRGYQKTAPYLTLWGILWAVGYTFSFLFPAKANFAWLAIAIGGTVVGIFISRPDHDQARSDWRYLGLIPAFFLFIGGSIAVMQPSNPNAVAAFTPLVVALGYVVSGVFGAPRLLVTGIGIWVLTLLGFFAFSGIFLLWMAVVGGGGLILGGFWLRRV